MNNDERYIQNIRDGLMARALSVRVDAHGNLMNLAILSENFYCELLNILLDCHLRNDNSVQQNAAGIDLTDEDARITVQVSVTCTHEKIQSSIDKFVPPVSGKWRFCFVPITAEKPTLRKEFDLPDWLTFDKKRDVLDIPRIMELVRYAGIEKQRKLSELVDLYCKEYAKERELTEYLRNTLRTTRDNHPSFVLLRKDGIDERLFPQAKELKQFESRGRVAGSEKVSPVWDIIRESWQSGEHRSVVIEGAGGIGKTVTLFSVTNINDGEIPPAVYVPMHRLVDKDGSCIDLTAYLEIIHKGITDLVKGSWNGTPKLLVLLDGFNEVPGDKRRSILRMVNDWYQNNTGAQLIAVSRQMNGMDLKSDLKGDPLSITLEPLSRETVREYLGDKTPPESSPAWNVLTRPLFLNLYIKSARLEEQTSDGYPLAPKPSESGGALIWNYLQRELLKINWEDWVLRCAVACEYILPYIAYRMEREHRYTIERKLAMTYINDALDSIDPERLPRHLADIFDEYDNRHFDYPDLSQYDWKNTVFNDVGLLIADKKSYSFIHQNFRDALAGLYLVNQAEMMADELPEVWRRTANHYVMDYAAELMDEREADKLWEANRKLRPTDSAATYAMMELQRRRFDGIESKLDFSGMDLRGISLTRYLGLGQIDMKLFNSILNSVDSLLDIGVFRSQGHSMSIYGSVLTDDGICVSCSADKTLRVWDIYTGECLHVLKGHSSPVPCIAMIDNDTCISGSYDDTLRIWNIREGKLQRTINWDKGSSRCIAVGDNGIGVIGGIGGILEVWDMRAGVFLRSLDGHTATVRCATIIESGLCITGSDDHNLRVWDMTTGQCLRMLEGHTDSVRCIAAITNEQCISGSYDNTIRVWNIRTGECIRILTGHTGRINCVLTTKKEYCISGSSDNILQVWSISTGNRIRVLEKHNGAVNCLAVRNGIGVSGSDDNTLRVWDEDFSRCLFTLEGNSSPVICASTTNDARCISGSYDGKLRVWSLHTGACLFHLIGHTTPINCVAALDNGICISGSRDGALKVWNINERKCLRTLKGHLGSIRCVAATDDGFIISGSVDTSLRVWNIDSGECIKVLKGHNHWINCVAVTRDGHCVSGSDDKSLRVWDINTGECLRIITGHTSWVNCVEIVDDSLCLCGTWDGALWLWNINTGEHIRAFEGHTDSVNCITMIDQNHFVSGSDDNTMRVWDINAGECLQVIDGHVGWVNCLSVTDDGLCISGSWDGTLQIWDVFKGKSLNTLFPLEIDVSKMNFSKAKLSSALAKALWQNGAKISPAAAENLVKTGGKPQV